MNSFREESLINNDNMTAQTKVACTEDAAEINTREQLRESDEVSDHLNSDTISTIAAALKVDESEITDIEALKKGMTNRSFLFTCRGKKYIMRIPGEGTGQLINRKQEAAVYNALKGKGLCDDPVYLNPENGCKITNYLEDAKVCDSENDEQLKLCMKKLKSFHDLNLQVQHTFDIFGQIEFYESLRGGGALPFTETMSRLKSRFYH